MLFISKIVRDKVIIIWVVMTTSFVTSDKFEFFRFSATTLNFWWNQKYCLSHKTNRGTLVLSPLSSKDSFYYRTFYDFLSAFNNNNTGLLYRSFLLLAQNALHSITPARIASLGNLTYC